MSRTLHVRKHWFPWLCENCIGSSGEGGSLMGMRRSFWGQDAYVVRCYRYLFRVDEDTFKFISSNT